MRCDIHICQLYQRLATITVLTILPFHIYVFAAKPNACYNQTITANDMLYDISKIYPNPLTATFGIEITKQEKGGTAWQKKKGFRFEKCTFNWRKQIRPN